MSRASYWTEARRQAAARAGYALPDGSWPITTPTDLRNAIRGFGRASNREKIARHITARAAALNLTHTIPAHIRVKAR